MSFSQHWVGFSSVCHGWALPGLLLPSPNTSGFFSNPSFVHESQVLARRQQITPVPLVQPPCAQGGWGKALGAAASP